jgi:uncharacterized membrane protein
MKTKYDKQFLDEMSKDPGNWKGFFYFNRKDPRIFVPKLNPSMGWTLNFASPYAYLTLIGIVLVVIIVQVFLK